MFQHPLDVRYRVYPAPGISGYFRVLAFEKSPAKQVCTYSENDARIRGAISGFFRNPEFVEFGGRFLSVWLFEGYLDFASGAKLCIRTSASAFALCVTSNSQLRREWKLPALVVLGGAGIQANHLRREINLSPLQSDPGEHFGSATPPWSVRLRVMV